MSIKRVTALIVFTSLIVVGYFMISMRQQANGSFELRFPNSSVPEASIKSFETVSTNADSMSSDFSMVDFFRCSDEIIEEIVRNQSIKLVLIQDGNKLGEFTFSKDQNDGKEYGKMSEILQLIHERNKDKEISQSFKGILDAIQRRNLVLVYCKESASPRSGEYLVIPVQDKSSPTPFVAYVSSRH